MTAQPVGDHGLRFAVARPHPGSHPVQDVLDLPAPSGIELDIRGITP